MNLSDITFPLDPRWIGADAFQCYGVGPKG